MARDKISKEELVLIEALVANGVTEDKIAAILDVHRTTFSKAKKTKPELLAVLDSGKIEYMGKIGRAQWMPDLAMIKQAARRGLSDAQIAARCGVSLATFRKRKIDVPEIDIAIYEGRAESCEKVANRLYESALKDNNTVAQIFWLKAQGEWKDQYSKVEHQVEGTVTHQHQFIAPDILQSDEWQQMIAKNQAASDTSNVRIEEVKAVEQPEIKDANQPTEEVIDVG